MKKHRFEKKIRVLSLALAFSLCFTTVFSLSVLTGYGLLVFAKKTKTAIVTSQIELNKALRDSAVNDIKIKSDEKDLKIRKGNYGGVKLTINAAKANIINNGSNFDGITIQNAGSFTENGDNNNVVSKDSRIKVTVKAASDNLKLVIAKKNSEVDITAAGSNTSLAITKPGNTTTLAVKESAASTLDYVDASDIRLCKTSSASGGASVSSVAVNAASTLIIKGSVREPIPVEMTANKAALKSSVRTNVSVYAKVDVIFKKGAEGSTVTTKKDGASAKVKNNTKGTVELIGKYGSAVMEPGDKGKVSDAIKDDAVSSNNVTTVTGNTVTGNTVTGNTVTGNTVTGNSTGGGGGVGGGSYTPSSSSRDDKKTDTDTKPDPDPSDVTPSTNVFDYASTNTIYQKKYIKLGDYDRLLSYGYSDPIEWEVLGEDENGLLVMSTRVMSLSTYGGSDDSTWEDSYLRSRMNDNIYSVLFTSEEKQKIKPTIVDDCTTPDYLFALSMDELGEYFGDTLRTVDEEKYSPYLMAEGIYSMVRTNIFPGTEGTVWEKINEDEYNDNLKKLFYTEDCIYKEEYESLDDRKAKYWSWWLRDSIGDGKARYVKYNGMIGEHQMYPDSLGVRPVMYLDKEKLTDDDWVSYMVEPSYVKFGHYSNQMTSDNLPITQEIEWMVLDENENGILLLSKDVLDCQEYNSYFESEDKTEMTEWGGSFLKYWLNDMPAGFYDTAFTETEKSRIKKVTVEDLKNPVNDAGGGTSSECKVFCLSAQELAKYIGFNYYDEEKQIGYSEKLICEATPYAQSKSGAMRTYTITPETYLSFYEEKKYSTNCVGNPGCQWFVRTAADNDGNICLVDCDGAIHMTVGKNIESLYGVRPAIYVNPVY